MKAFHPKSHKAYYFIEKCLPFGSSISFSNFQRVSDAIEAIYAFKTKGRRSTNYLDNFLFTALKSLICNGLVSDFLQVCSEINIPGALEKTVWATQIIAFLDMLLYTRTQTISVPEDKGQRAIDMLLEILYGEKATILRIQQLTGLISYLCKAIYPGRSYVRHFYAKIANPKL